jgi:hypothetical protein
VDLSLVSVDSTAARAHQDAAGMHLDPGVLSALETCRQDSLFAPRPQPV